MRNPSSLLLALALLATGLPAQEAGGSGFLNIVNLIPGKIPAEVRIGGKELIPGGMKPGDFTGWFMVPAGEKSLSIELAKPETEATPAISKEFGKIDVTTGIANLVAMFLQPSLRVKEDGTPFPPRIRIRSFPAYECKGYGLKFVSACTAEKRFQIGPLKLDAKPFDPIDIPNWSGAGFEIIHDGKSIGKTAGSSEPNPFYLFVADGEDGGYITALIRSGTQQAPPWIEEKKTTEKTTGKP